MGAAFKNLVFTSHGLQSNEYTAATSSIRVLQFASGEHSYSLPRYPINHGPAMPAQPGRPSNSPETVRASQLTTGPCSCAARGAADHVLPTDVIATYARSSSDSLDPTFIHHLPEYRSLARTTPQVLDK